MAASTNGKTSLADLSFSTVVFFLNGPSVENQDGSGHSLSHEFWSPDLVENLVHYCDFGTFNPYEDSSRDRYTVDDVNWRPGRRIDPPPEILPAALTEDELRNQVRVRRIKDDVQDAWLDMFLLRIKTHPAITTYARNLARKIDLYKFIQLGLDAWNVGTIDSDIHQRLEARCRLFKQKSGFDRPPSPTSSFIQSANKLLQESLSQQHEHTPKAGLLSLRQTAEKTALKSLAAAVDQDKKSALFACGGSVPRRSENSTELMQGFKSDDPVRVWWKNAASTGQVCFPSPEDTGDDDATTLVELVKACEPATFGRGQQDVLDKSYRNAGKLDPADFLTDFCPYRAGIIHEVEHMLGVAAQGTRIRCRLYKLNVYSGPSGIFRSHVDTPQGEDHFASLVVCLPARFHGGALVLRHEGHEVIFDWSDNSSQVRWAAFYSDCEHEVEEITAGHRVTFTYNLFAVAEQDTPHSGIDPTSLSVFRQLGCLLESPGFLPKGAVLGVPCSHYYAHDSNDSGDLSPVLKGTDRALFLALDHLHIKKQVSIILANDRNKYGGIALNEFYDTGGMEVSYFAHERLSEFRNPGDGIRQIRYRQKGNRRDLRLEYSAEENLDDFYEPGQYSGHPCRFEIYPFESSTIESRIDELNGRRVKGIDHEYVRGSDVVVSRSMQSIRFVSSGEQADNNYDEVIDHHIPHTRLSQVVWLQKPRKGPSEAVQLAYLAYGNDATLRWTYSRAAILFVIPPWHERMRSASTTENAIATPQHSVDSSGTCTEQEATASTETDTGLPKRPHSEIDA